MYMCAEVTESSCIIQAQVDSCHDVAVAASNGTGSGSNWHLILQYYHHLVVVFLDTPSKSVTVVFGEKLLLCLAKTQHRCSFGIQRRHCEPFAGDCNLVCGVLVSLAHVDD